MSFLVDLDRRTLELRDLCCDLCRREGQLFRLLYTTDALCQSCFVMWHG